VFAGRFGRQTELSYQKAKECRQGRLGKGSAMGLPEMLATMLEEKIVNGCHLTDSDPLEVVILVRYE